MALRKKGREGTGVSGEKRQWRKALIKCWRSVLAAIVREKNLVTGSCTASKLCMHMNSGQLVRLSVDLKDNTQPTVFSDWIYTKVSENKSQAMWKLLLLQMDNSSFYCSWSVQCPLPFCFPFFFPCLHLWAWDLFLWWCGNGISVKLGFASESSHTSCLPLWNIFVLGELAGSCFQRIFTVPTGTQPRSWDWSNSIHGKFIWCQAC